MGTLELLCATFAINNSLLEEDRFRLEGESYSGWSLLLKLWCSCAAALGGVLLGTETESGLG